MKDQRYSRKSDAYKCLLFLHVCLYTQYNFLFYMLILKTCILELCCSFHFAALICNRFLYFCSCNSAVQQRLCVKVVKFCIYELIFCNRKQDGLTKFYNTTEIDNDHQNLLILQYVQSCIFVYPTPGPENGPFNTNAIDNCANYQKYDNVCIIHKHTRFQSGINTEYLHSGNIKILFSE